MTNLYFYEHKSSDIHINVMTKVIIRLSITFHNVGDDTCNFNDGFLPVPTKDISGLQQGMQKAMSRFKMSNVKEPLMSKARVKL